MTPKLSAEELVATLYGIKGCLERHGERELAERIPDIATRLLAQEFTIGQLCYMAEPIVAEVLKEPHWEWTPINSGDILELNSAVTSARFQQGIPHPSPQAEE